MVQAVAIDITYPGTRLAENRARQEAITRLDRIFWERLPEMEIRPTEVNGDPGAMFLVEGKLL